MSRRHHYDKHHTFTLCAGEQATPERKKQNGGLITEVIDKDYSGNVIIKRQRVAVECVIDCYHLEKWLTDLQRKTALIYRAYYVRVHLGPYSKIFEESLRDISGHGEPDAAMIAHIHCIELLELAEEELTKAQLKVVRRVCGYDQPAGDTRHRLTLQRALDVLAEFWKLK